MNPKRSIHHFTDEHGDECSRVALAKAGTFAIVLTADLAHITQAGFTLNWQLDHTGRYAYVRAAEIGTNQTHAISRVITGASRGHIVEYVSGNPLDLRRRNLRVVPRPSRRRSDALADRLAEQFAADVAAVTPVAAQEAHA